MGLYRKTGSPYWYACYMEPVTGSDGYMMRRADGSVVSAQRHRSTKQRGKTAAKNILLAWESEGRLRASWTRNDEEDRLRVRRAADAERARETAERARGAFTVADLRDAWLAEVKSKKSIAADRQRFGVIVDYFGADRPVGNITGDDVTTFRDVMLERPTRRGTPHRPSTVNRYLALLRSAVKLATERDLLPGGLPLKFRMLRENNARDRLCSDEEYRRLCDAAPPKLRLAIVLGFHTGMRLGEISALTTDQVDFTERVVRLQAADTKTGKARMVPLSREAMAALKAWDDVGADGRYLDVGTESLSPQFSRLVQSLEIEDLRFHDLRHTCATRLRRAGVDVFTIAAVTGHTSMAMLRRYQSVTADDLVAAVERVEGNG